MSERIVEAVERLKSVFQESPGTHLTAAEASRLTGIAPSLRESLISVLKDARILRHAADGRYRYQGTDRPTRELSAAKTEQT